LENGILEKDVEFYGKCQTFSGSSKRKITLGNFHLSLSNGKYQERTDKTKKKPWSKDLSGIIT